MTKTHQCYLSARTLPHDAFGKRFRDQFGENGSVYVQYEIDGVNVLPRDPEVGFFQEFYEVSEVEILDEIFWFPNHSFDDGESVYAKDLNPDLVKDLIECCREDAEDHRQDYLRNRFSND